MVAGVVIVALSTYEWLEGRLETAGLAAGVVVGLILAIILGARPLWNEYVQPRLRRPLAEDIPLEISAAQPRQRATVPPADLPFAFPNSVRSGAP